jgi:hypothetical protein
MMYPVHEWVNHPRSACFVHRDGVDTLLIADSGNNRVVEVTARGEFMRAIVVDGLPCGVAERNGVTAVSLSDAHAVVLLPYETGVPKVTIGSGTAGRGDGELWHPMGVAFTAEGRCILVADFMNHRVSTFSADSGAFVAHAATREANGIPVYNPTDVLQCEDGSIVVVS